MDWYDPTCYATEILDAKYEKVEADKVFNQLINHLSLEQKEDLRKVLKEHTKLFSGKLGVYPHWKFHIDLVPGAIAKHARPYPVPVIHLSAFKNGLLHLVKIRRLVIARCKQMGLTNVYHSPKRWQSPLG